MAVIECVPNVSEGRRTEVIQRLADSLKAVPGLSVLDVQSDAAHNRSVFTLAGDTDAMAAGIPRLIEGAMAAIDLRSHRGEHPRMGAVDVVPFIPIEGVTMEACVQLAKSIAADVAARFSLPVYLYEEASSNPARKNLEDIRRGEFEGLAAKMAEAAWAPAWRKAWGTLTCTGARSGSPEMASEPPLAHTVRSLAAQLAFGPSWPNGVIDA